jgi:hypothetical protein
MRKTLKNVAMVDDAWTDTETGEIRRIRKCEFCGLAFVVKPNERNPKRRHRHCREVVAYVNAVVNAAKHNPSIMPAVVALLLRAANQLPRRYHTTRDPKGRFSK